MTLQGLIYSLRSEKLTVGKVIKANIIMPWRTVLPIRFVIKEKTPIVINNKKIPAFEINLEADNIIGQILPKSKLWVSEKEPHILLKQKGFNNEYELITF